MSGNKPGLFQACLPIRITLEMFLFFMFLVIYFGRISNLPRKITRIVQGAEHLLPKIHQLMICFAPCASLSSVSAVNIFAVKGQAGITLGFEGHAAHHSHSVLFWAQASRQHVTHRHVCVPVKLDLQDQVAGGLWFTRTSSLPPCVFFCSKPLMFLLVQILRELCKDFCLSSPIDHLRFS